MKILLSLFALITVGLVMGCAHTSPVQMNMFEEIRKARTPADHNSLAKHYEDTAKEMQSKVDEHKKMLAEYEAHRETYGRRGLDMESMCKALLHVYSEAVNENMNLAESHRKMAAEIK